MLLWTRIYFWHVSFSHTIIQFVMKICCFDMQNIFPSRPFSILLLSPPGPLMFKLPSSLTSGHVGASKLVFLLLPLLLYTIFSTAAMVIHLKCKWLYINIDASLLVKIFQQALFSLRIKANVITMTSKALYKLTPTWPPFVILSPHWPHCCPLNTPSIFLGLS